MIRGLQIRRIFLLMDVVLVAIFIGIVAGNVWLPSPPVWASQALDSAIDVSGGEDVAPIVEARAAYDPIVQSGLFGDAGRYDPHSVPAPPPAPVEPPKPAEEDIEESELTNLRLVGTLALAPGAANSAAFIENSAEQTGAKGYVAGETVIENVKLLEVFPRRVILLNEIGGQSQKEYLSMEDAKEEEDSKLASTPGKHSASPAGRAKGAGTSGKGASSKGSEAAKPDRTGKIQLDLDDFERELQDNFQQLLAIRPIEKRDDKGNLVGLTANNLSQYPLASKLGIQEGDVLQTINGEQVQSEQQIMQMIQKYEDTTSFQIGILRNNSPMMLNYNLK